MGTRIYDAVTAISFVPPAIVPLTAFDPTTDTIIDVRGFKSKAILVQNTGANSLAVAINGSYDEGVTFPLTILSSTPIASGNQSNTQITDYYTHFQIRVSSAAATTAQIQFCAIGI